MDLSTRQGRREQGQRLQSAVERAGFSIEELAVRLGCSRALIYQYLSGSTLAQPDRMQRIAAICDVSLASFYEEGAISEASNSAIQSPSIPTSQTPQKQDADARLNETLLHLRALAEAQESPINLQVIAATYYQIIHVASQLGDSAILAHAQMKVGNALLRTGEFPSAAEALERAVGVAQETGDIQSEVSARQCLGSALAAMGRTEDAKIQFEHIAKGPVFRGRWQGTISLGGIHEMQGEYQSAMAKFDEAAAMLEEESASGQVSPEEISSGLTYVNTNRRNVYMDGGDFEAAKLLASEGMAGSESIGNADQHLEARFDLAWCEFNCGRWAGAFRGFSSMLQLARFTNDVGRETMARAWLGIMKAAAGDFDSAVELGENALSSALKHGDRRGELYAQLALADAFITQGNRTSEARYHTNQALAVTISSRQERGEIECRLRLSRLAAQESNTLDLQENADRSLLLSLRLGSRHLESLARCWQCVAFLQGKDTSAEMLARLRDSIQMALSLATSISFSEGIWRANHILGRLYLREVPQNTELAEQSLRSAIFQLSVLRNQLLDIGLSDTLLENRDCLAVYIDFFALLNTKNPEESAKFIEESAWPPLEALAAKELSNPIPDQRYL